MVHYEQRRSYSYATYGSVQLTFSSFVWPVARFAQGASLHVLCRQWLSLYRVDPYYDLVCGQWPDLNRVHLARGQWPRLYRVHLFSLL